MANKVFVLVLDGIVHDYKDISTNTPYLDHIAKEGVKADRMIPPFPSDTWPVMASLMTGMHPQTHGIVSNVIYDKERDATFKYTDDPQDTNNARFFTKEPVWLANQMQGGSSAVYYMPGYYAFEENPTHHNQPIEGWSEDIAQLQKCIEEAARLLTSGDVNLAVVYAGIPDGTAHEYGKHSKEYREALEEVDREIVGCAVNKLPSDVNLIVVADHGFVDVTHARYFHEFLKEVSYRATGHGASCFIHPMNGSTVEQLMRDLQPLAEDPNYAVYRSGSFPEHLNYGSHKNTAPILVLSAPGHVFINGNKNPHLGWHGYDNKCRQMSTVFLAKGRAFKRGVKLGAISAINVAPLIAHLLGVQLNEDTEGNAGVFQNVLN